MNKIQEYREWLIVLSETTDRYEFQRASLNLSILEDELTVTELQRAYAPKYQLPTRK